ncbi:leucine-rich repeat extensin-like protein 1 [Lycium barbarum]|uniref:leucine-rich repeat extensin-like protein 1 n=1 Tax=Lycium barbarum TaxID=112863 RepID=UPI00293F5C04|nr:leucine-rich repeat extensin-like protein 1 [Lycium barbarum]
MKHAKFLSLAPIMTTKCSLLLLCVAFSLANCQDPNAGLLCISDCTTCPVICSPPPSPTKSKPPPSPSPSPSTSLLQTPPPPPPLFAPLRPSPPQSSSHSTSPPSAHKSPPPSYMIYTGAPPPFRPSNCPTPPNSPNVIPASQVPPAVVGQNTYPYYYYFSSEAASLSFHDSIVLGLWVVFHFICICS